MVIGGGLIRRPRLEKRTPAAFLSFLLFFLLCVLSRVRLVDNIFLWFKVTMYLWDVPQNRSASSFRDAGMRVPERTLIEVPVSKNHLCRD